MDASDFYSECDIEQATNGDVEDLGGPWEGAGWNYRIAEKSKNNKKKYKRTGVHIVSWTKSAVDSKTWRHYFSPGAVPH